MRKPKLLPLQEANDALSAAESTLARWSEEAAAATRAAEVLAAELVEAQARAGDDLLDDDDPDALTRIAGELTRRQNEQTVAVEASYRAADRLADVRRDVLRARAAATRARAAALRETVTARQDHTARMLATLAEFEGVAYAVADLNASGMGAPFRPNTMTHNLAGRATWLDNHADHFDLVANDGLNEAVSALASMPIPEVSPIELIGADPGLVPA